MSEHRNFDEEFATDAMPGSSHPPEPAPQQPVPKRLYRSKDQRMLLGVCGGLAEYFDIDATIVRVVFVVLTIAGLSGVLLYIALAIIMPSEDKLDIHPREAARSTFDEAGQTVQDAANKVTDWVRSVTGGRSKTADTSSSSQGSSSSYTPPSTQQPPSSPPPPSEPPQTPPA